MNIQQRELENLVKEVLRKRDRIIPVVGDDAFEGIVNVNGIEHCFPLQRWLAEKLLGDEVEEVTKNKIYHEGYRGLDLMYEEFKILYPDESFIEYRESIVNTIEQCIRDKELRLRKDIKEFLVAGQFEVIATTCPYHILENELKSENYKYNISSFAPIASKQRVFQTSRAEETLSLPSIYQIFGDCEGEYVSGEEDLLKFLHYLNQTNTEKGFGASQLVKYIKDKGQDNKGLGLLMPIGCNNLPNWLFRFLWYPFSQDCLIGNDKLNQGGVWYEHTTDENFYKFLKKYKFRTFSGPTDILKQDDSESDPVLKRLSDELGYKAENLHKFISSVLKVQSYDNGEWDIFISYAKEDELLAKKAYEILTSCCNKKVWLDSRDGIKAGDDYWEAIIYGIKHSQRFIFIITNSYLDKAREKNHKDETGIIRPSGVYQEIDLIAQHLIANKKDGQRGVCLPLILNGTKATYTDYDGVRHENEILVNGVLEKLPKYKEYEVMQTDKLFFQIQDMICTIENLEEDLVKIFK